MDDRHAWLGDVGRRIGGGFVAKHLISKDNVRIAMTHHVPKEDFENFDRILKTLCTQRTIITPNRFFQYFSGQDRDRIFGRELLLTFDDGLLSSYEFAQQVLNPAGVKAIFFIPTGILELTTPEEMREFASVQINFGIRAPESLRSEEFVAMNAAHLRELHDQGHMILPHTHSHLQLRDITTPGLVERELVRPKAIIEDLLQSPADGFASPSGTPGTISPYAYRHISNLYALCFTALAGANTHGTDPIFIRRDSIHPWYSVEHANNIVEGIFDPYFLLKAKALRRQANWKYLSAARAARLSERSVTGPEAGQERTKFVARVTEVFERADVNYVLLHGYGQDGVDSDLDVAVDRESLNLADAIIRTGVLGRVVQCLHYAVPWCRYYILEVDEPGRRYRQLDVVCDPWGIGRDGIAVPIALSRTLRIGDTRVPDPAAETLYLAVKRARKRMSARSDHQKLSQAFRRDGAGATSLLSRHFGSAGASLAAALERGELNLVEELEAVRRRLARQQRAPAALMRRLGFSAGRVVRRAVQPTGLVVCLVGPDGVGKSTLADALQRSPDLPFRRTVRLHSTPGFVPSRARLLRRPVPSGTEPHGASPSGTFGSVARVAYVWLDTLLGWWLKIAPARARAVFVLVERGWLDVSVDPLRYRVSLPSRVVHGACRTLPRPDLTLFLRAPTDVTRARKPELGSGEIERQLEAWQQLAARDPSRFVTVDSSRPLDVTLDEAMRAIEDRLAARQRDLRACSLALRCLGGLWRGGDRYSIISRRGEPRWVVPTRVAAPGPRSAGLYRPPGAWHAAGALALEALQRVGIAHLRSGVTVDTARGLCADIAGTLGLTSYEVVAAVTGDWRRGERALLTFMVGRRSVAFVKVARQERANLEHEGRVLEVLGSCRLESLSVPELIDSFSWEDCSVLVLGPVETRARTNRPLGAPELAGLAELAKLEPLAAAGLGSMPGLVPVHGDFAPWNSAPRVQGGLVLWDWEETHLGLPLEDLFYWRLQRLVRFGQGTVASLVSGALTPDDKINTLSEKVGVASEVAAPRALRACLERCVDPAGLSNLPPMRTEPRGREQQLHKARTAFEALALLESRGL